MRWINVSANQVTVWRRSPRSAVGCLSSVFAGLYMVTVSLETIRNRPKSKQDLDLIGD